MPVFITIIVVSFILYIYFKVRILTQKDRLYMHYTNAKARIALGIFITAFAANQYVYYQTQIALFICIILGVLGILQIVHGTKLFKHYRKEVQRVYDN